MRYQHLILGIGLGLVLGFVIGRGYGMRAQGDFDRKILQSVPRVEIVAARTALPEGAVLKRSDLAVVDVPAGEVNNPILLQDVDRIIGHKTLTRLEERQSIHWSDVEGNVPKASNLITISHREITSMTPVDRGGQVYVDLFINRDAEDRIEGQVGNPGAASQLQLLFPAGFKRVTIGAGLWSNTNNTVLIRLVGGDELRVRDTLIAQWKAAMQAPRADQ